VLLTPGTNKISAVKLVIAYNPQQFQRGDPGIIPNTNAFPQVFEGPLYDQCFSTICTMSISLAIGSDVMKAVQGQSAVPIATVNLKALQATDTNGAIVSFGNGSTVLSIAAGDEPSENVANFIPALVVVGLTPVINASPSATMTSGTINLHFEGIDSNNNPLPKHKQRQAELDFYKGNSFINNPDFKIPFLVTNVNNDMNGTFINNAIDLTKVPPSSYYILVKSAEGSLREALNNSQVIPIVAGQNNKLNGPPADPNATNPTTEQVLRMGDLNNDNTVDINDYMELIRDLYYPNISLDKFSDKENAWFYWEWGIDSNDVPKVLDWG